MIRNHNKNHHIYHKKKTIYFLLFDTSNRLQKKTILYKKKPYIHLNISSAGKEYNVGRMCNNLKNFSREIHEGEWKIYDH